MGEKIDVQMDISETNLKGYISEHGLKLLNSYTFNLRKPSQSYFEIYP